MLHARIKKLRTDRGLSEADMAHGLCMSQSAYSPLEGGHTRMDMDRLLSIARVPNVQAWELLVPEQWGQGEQEEDDLMRSLIGQAAGRVPEAVLLRIVHLHADQQAEVRQVHARHARAARRILKLLGW
ncbi:MAG: helix-turn-helix transcriptional regulator [Flavobacteriales bacterium]|nr:helix-turn-helix transcriptional regulator [Flavobacteriales bacterium]